MYIYLRIRYLDRKERTFKNRDLFLDTDALAATDRAAVELVMKLKTSESQRDMLKFRGLFREGWFDPGSIDRLGAVRNITTFVLSDYLEDENGDEVDSAAIWTYMRPAQEEETEAAEPKPVPLATVSLTPNEVRLLGYFIRDCKELDKSTFMNEKPGTLSSCERLSSTGKPIPGFKTALSDEEVRSFVTIFRRLYMEKEPANLLKAAELFEQVVGDHPWTRLVSQSVTRYKEYLTSNCDVSASFRASTWPFTTKRLIDIFIYTQYAHQPSEDRQRQFLECLTEVENNRALLTGMFLCDLWELSVHICNVGNLIDAWFQRYCNYHGVAPDVLGSLREEGIGFETLEKEQDRRQRLIRESVEELANELWKQGGMPEGGPSQFRAMASDELRRAVNGGDSEPDS
jgi:hypothetical protein